MSIHPSSPPRIRRLKSSVWIAILLLLTAIVVKFFLEYRPSILFPQWKDYQVFGIDLSKYQGDVDWYQLKNHDVQFAFMKASEGENLIDRNFKENWHSARQAGIRRGAYHFYRPSIDWKRQAKLYIKNVELEKGDLPPIIDIELIHSRNQKHLVAEIKKWLTVVEKHYGIKPIVYTYENYYNRFLLEDFRGYNLWIAKYSHSSPKLEDGARWEFWQYSESGKLVGIDHKVDLNCFYGTKEEFQKILKK
jgi:lysozyme